MPFPQTALAAREFSASTEAAILPDTSQGSRGDKAADAAPAAAGAPHGQRALQGLAPHPAPAIVLPPLGPRASSSTSHCGGVSCRNKPQSSQLGGQVRRPSKIQCLGDLFCASRGWREEGAHRCTRTHTHAHMCTRTHTHTHVHTHAHVHAHMHVHAHALAHTYIHAGAHTQVMPGKTKSPAAALEDLD